ncbi:DUF4070 domain-containing protein [Thiorhodovibrio frisius]|nr:DUF4070 domain-containing protein [Thiorhodovibrio frisius]
MRALLIYPRFRESYWSFEKVMELINKRAMMPPLGLVTVAAILPQTWDMRLRDHNIEPITTADWEWAEIVLFSGMLVQKDDMRMLIAEARRRRIPSACGGPYATALPNELRAAGADYLVLDEGELTIPMWLEDTYRHYQTLGGADVHTNPDRRKKKAPKPRDPDAWRALLIVIWRQGVKRKTRFAFWQHLLWMARNNRGGLGSYLGLCSYIEHFLPYRELVKVQIQTQLAAYSERERQLQLAPSSALTSTPSSAQ